MRLLYQRLRYTALLRPPYASPRPCRFRDIGSQASPGRDTCATTNAGLDWEEVTGLANRQIRASGASRCRWPSSKRSGESRPALPLGSRRRAGVAPRLCDRLHAVPATPAPSRAGDLATPLGQRRPRGPRQCRIHARARMQVSAQSLAATCLSPNPRPTEGDHGSERPTALLPARCRAEARKAMMLVAGSKRDAVQNDAFPEDIAAGTGDVHIAGLRERSRQLLRVVRGGSDFPPCRDLRSRRSVVWWAHRDAQTPTAWTSESGPHRFCNRTPRCRDGPVPGWLSPASGSTRRMRMVVRIASSVISTALPRHHWQMALMVKISR